MWTISFGLLSISCFFMFIVGTMKCFYCLQKVPLWSPWIPCPPLIRFLFGTSTLVTCGASCVTTIF